MTADVTGLDRRRQRARNRKRMVAARIAFFAGTALIICTAASIAAGTEKERPQDVAVEPMQTVLVMEYEDTRPVDLPEVTAYAPRGRTDFPAGKEREGGAIAGQFLFD